MLYSTVLIDMFNLIHRKKVGETTAKDIANAVIDFVEGQAKAKLSGDDGAIFLLFDPMPTTDLGVSSQLRTFTTTRKAIKASYKANREKDPVVIEVADYLLKYFSYRDPAFRIVISEKHEADDFVETLIGPGKTLLVSTDYDWARYLSKDVDMSIGDLNQPFTADDFEAKFGYRPSIKNVTVNKALFGDESDHVAGIFTQKFKCRELGETAMGFIARQDETLDAFIARVKGYTFKGLFEMKSRNPEEELFYQMHCFEKENPVTPFFTNVAVLRSLCPDASKYVKKFEKKDAGFCAVIDKTLGRDGVKRPFRFGNVRV